MTARYALQRVADLVLPALDPERVPLGSYDVASHGPTREALRRLARTGELPATEVPGAYALVAYEEAALARHGRVADLLEGRGPVDAADGDEALAPSRALAFLEAEAYLTGILTDCEEASSLACSLLSFPAVLGPRGRRALAADLADVARVPPSCLSPANAWMCALALPGVLASAGATAEELTSAWEVLLERKGDALRHALEAAWFDPIDALERGERVALDLETGWVERCGPDGAWDSTPCFVENYDRIVSSLAHWSPPGAEHLSASWVFPWTERGVALRATPVAGRPLWFHELTIDERP